LDKHRIKIQKQEIEGRVVDISTEHLKELENELLKLRIEIGIC